LFAILNLRPVYDIKMGGRESEKWMKQRRIESLECEKRLKLLNEENERLSPLESRMTPLLLNADSSSQTPPTTSSI